MSIAEALEQISEFERIEDTALNHKDVMTTVFAKHDFLVYLQKHEPMAWLAYQRTLGHPPTAVS